MSPQPRIYRSQLPDVPLPKTSVFDFLFSSDALYPKNFPAYIDAATGRTLTRDDVKDLALRLGWGLKHKLGKRRGDTIMIFSMNSLAYPILIFGALAAGLRITYANSSYTPAELAHQYKDSGASHIFVDPLLVPVALETLRSDAVKVANPHERLVVMGLGGESYATEPSLAGFGKMENLIGEGKLDRAENFDGDKSHETVYLCYSSGTTGLSKGVETTHHNLTSNIRMFNAPSSPWVNHQNGDVFIGVVPSFHILGLLVLHWVYTAGVPYVICQRFDPEVFCSSIEKYKITASFVVPPILVALNALPVIEKYDLSSLRHLICAAAPLSPALARSVAARLTKRGCKNITIGNAYGLTETSPGTHALVGGPKATERLGTVGPLFPNIECRLVDDEGQDVAPERGGEMWIRGPIVMKGYLNNPKATAASITPDGWFKTGDIAIRHSDGFFSIIDRKKELIKYKGFQVPPAELEGLLLGHPDIADVGVIGVVDNELATELPRAYVVPRTKIISAATQKKFSEAICRWAEERVANHKRLRGGVVLVDAIPKSPSGKILRRELRLLASKPSPPAQELAQSRL